jgi:hypothetical protein
LSRPEKIAFPVPDSLVKNAFEIESASGQIIATAMKTKAGAMNASAVSARRRLPARKRRLGRAGAVVNRVLQVGGAAVAVVATAVPLVVT